MRTYPVSPNKVTHPRQLLTGQELACNVLSTHADSALDTERQKLQDIEFTATQEEGTELPFMLLILRIG